VAQQRSVESADDAVHRPPNEDGQQEDGEHGGHAHRQQAEGTADEAERDEALGVEVAGAEADERDDDEVAGGPRGRDEAQLPLRRVERLAEFDDDRTAGHHRDAGQHHRREDRERPEAPVGSGVVGPVVRPRHAPPSHDADGPTHRPAGAICAVMPVPAYRSAKTFRDPH